MSLEFYKTDYNMCLEFTAIDYEIQAVLVCLVLVVTTDLAWECACKLQILCLYI